MERFKSAAMATVVLVSFLSGMSAEAANKVVVIPLFGDDPTPLKNIVTVAKSGGDFTDPVAAVDSITNASSTNPYLIVIGPGVYTLTETLVMQEYVNIAGSGQEVTKLTGAISTGNSDTSSTLVSGASNAALTDLTVENTGDNLYTYAIYNDSASPRLERLTAIASGSGASTSNYAVKNSGASPKMIDVTATSSGGAITGGVLNVVSSAPTMINIAATGSGGTQSNFGVYNATSAPTMTNVTAIGQGGSTSYGVYNVFSATEPSTPFIEHSSLKGDTKGMQFGGSSGTLIVFTRIKGGIDADPDAGVKNCRQVYDEALAAIDC